MHGVFSGTVRWYIGETKTPRELTDIYLPLPTENLQLINLWNFREFFANRILYWLILFLMYLIGEKSHFFLPDKVMCGVIFCIDANRVGSFCLACGWQRVRSLDTVYNRSYLFNFYFKFTIFNVESEARCQTNIKSLRIGEKTQTCHAPNLKSWFENWELRGIPPLSTAQNTVYYGISWTENSE